MRVRGSATILVMSCLVLLFQASECAPRVCPPSVETEPRRGSGTDIPSPRPRLGATASPAEAPARREVPSTRTEGPPPRAEVPRPREDAPPAAATSPRANAPARPPTLDLASLEKRLRDTSAIGTFTKLSLKNQVDDLLDEFRAFHGGRGQATLPTLREGFDLLLLKVLSLLQDKDPALARDISASREALWNLLADPAKFANL